MHGALFLVSLLIPVSASAQPPSSSLWLTAERLPTIFVLDDQGTEHRGKLLRVDAEQLELLIDDKERIFKRHTVQRVQKRVTRSGTGPATGSDLSRLSGGSVPAIRGPAVSPTERSRTHQLIQRRSHRSRWYFVFRDLAS
jgi:hypothetical protein